MADLTALSASLYFLYWAALNIRLICSSLRWTCSFPLLPEFRIKFVFNSMSSKKCVNVESFQHLLDFKINKSFAHIKNVNNLCIRIYPKSVKLLLVEGSKVVISYWIVIQKTSTLACWYQFKSCWCIWTIYPSESF